MADRCRNYGDAGLEFPVPIFNRPALPEVDYRIGEFAHFVSAIRHEIDAATALKSWTHREPDDPGMALIDCAAIVGDILTFYQKLYANEAFLRTADWRESISKLTYLSGYRLAPGLAGTTIFAFTVRDTSPITIPAGLPLKAEIGEEAVMTDFATSEEITAYPHLGAFSLYRPRSYVNSVNAGTNALELHQAGGVQNIESLRAVELAEGDRILLMPDEGRWSQNTTDASGQKTKQFLTIKSVTEVLGRIMVEFEESIDRSWTGPVRAFRTGRTFRHFGHNAPPTYTTSQPSSGVITGSIEHKVEFTRHLDHDCTYHSILRQGSTLGLSQDEVALGDEIGDLALGGWLIVETRVKVDGSRHRMIVARQITSLEPATLQCGSLNGGSTLVELDRDLVDNNTILDSETDVRDIRIYEVTSDELKFRNVAGGAAGPFTSASGALFFYGKEEEAGLFSGRSLFLRHEDGRTQRLICVNVSQSADSWQPLVWMLDFDAVPSEFSLEEFDEANPTVSVFGNLCAATQGKRESDAKLGNGDNRAKFQTFKLPRAPLTYLFNAGATPTHQPELEIWVNDRLWTRVDTFYGHGPRKEIYVVREDGDGNSHVQFGDGITGSRLPSGKGNVIAKYRSGSGAYGELRAGSSPSAGERVDNLDKVLLPGLVSGGTAPESGDSARYAAPQRVQSLGRLVSLSDYEAEVLALSG
ncbi:MAG: hypothetical protein JSW34_03315, partial [Candidatus Zixiibacteriota bacterium]